MKQTCAYKHPGLCMADIPAEVPLHEHVKAFYKTLLEGGDCLGEFFCIGAIDGAGDRLGEMYVCLCQIRKARPNIFFFAECRKTGPDHDEATWLHMDYMPDQLTFVCGSLLLHNLLANRATCATIAIQRLDVQPLPHTL